MEATHPLLEREAQRRQQFYDRLSSLLDKQIPRLIKKAEKQSKRGRQIRVSTALRPRYSNLAPISVHGVDYGTFTRIKNETIEWIISEADHRLIKSGSPLRASIYESAAVGPYMSPNRLVLELPVVDTTPPARKRRRRR